MMSGADKLLENNTGAFEVRGFSTRGPPSSSSSSYSHDLPSNHRNSSASLTMTLSSMRSIRTWTGPSLLMCCLLKKALRGKLCVCVWRMLPLSITPYRQTDLRLVLKAYAMYNTKTGFCQVSVSFLPTSLVSSTSSSLLLLLQAMAPVAATLLMHMPAEVSRVHQRGGVG